MNIISFDAEKMIADVSEIENSIMVIDSVRKRMTESIGYLMNGWKGEAAVSFFQMYEADKDRIEDVLYELNELVDSLRYTVEKFEAAKERSLDVVGELIV